MTAYLVRMHSASRAAIRITLCCIAFAASSQTLAAQRVAGHVTESSSRTPIAGAVVTLLDSAGKTMARTITNAAGQYHLAGAGHAATITAIRIGFHPASATVPSVVADSGLTANLSLDVLPQLLDAVAVHDQALCPQTKDAPTAFALWDQARNALLANVVAREVDAPKVRSLLFTRELSANGRRIIKQTVSDSLYVASQPMTAVRTAEEFATKGYRIRTSTSDFFLGPDADVLLDSAFLAGHCLSLAGKSNPNAPEVGIAFAPTPHQDSIIDISGVLWLNRAAPALDSLTFHFTGLSAGETAAGAGGELVFTTMPTGVAMITHWMLHLPATSEQRLTVGGRGVQVTGVGGYSDTGGDLAEASWSDGTSWIGQLPMISGHVVAAGNGAPVPDATVQLAGTGMTAQTDSSGAFALPMTVPGPYVIEAQDDMMARLGVAWARSTSIDLAPSGTDIRLELPTRVGAADFSHGLKLLRVFDQATGARIDRATVRDTLGNEIMTSASGVVALNGLKPVAGYYMLEIRKPGYALQTLRLRADTTTQFRVALEANALGSATTLPTMFTTERKRLTEDPGLREGFVARCQMTGVQCVGRKDLDLEPTGQLAQILEKTPGVYIRCGATMPGLSGASAAPCGLQMTRSLPPPDLCMPTYYLNGSEWSPLAGTASDELDQFLTSSAIAGVEVYLSGMPHPNRFMVDPESHCGLVVIWTR